MTRDSILLAVTLATPLAILAIYLSFPAARWGRTCLPFAPVPALATTLLASDGSTLKLPDALLGLTLTLDKPGALLLGTVAFLWIAAALYAGADRHMHANDRRFTIWWLITLIGSLGIFIAADLAGFYLFFTIVSLAAYWLVVENATPSVRRAGIVYVSFALLGEAFLLLAFVLLAAAAPDGSLLIRDAVAALPTSSMHGLVLALLILGFGIKIGLVPLHVWMPLTYSAAPIPVAAVLSGAAVKAGVIGLIRFLPFDTASPIWGEALVGFGLFSAFYGVAIGVTQSNPKTVLAYSSTSQMGMIATILGMGLAAGDGGVAILAAFYALHHILVKGGLFLAVGMATRNGARGLWPMLLPAAVIALGLGGLPLTGGALAKSAVKGPLGEGMVGTLAMLSAAASTFLMLHFLRRLAASIGDSDNGKAPAGLLMPWLAIVCAAIALPWVLYSGITGESWLDALSPKAIWESLWPILVGGLLVVPLQRWGSLLPTIPPGDVLVTGAAVARAGEGLGVIMERIDWHLRQWAVAGILFLAFSVILVGIMFIGR